MKNQNSKCQDNWESIKLNLYLLVVTEPIHFIEHSNILKDFKAKRKKYSAINNMLNLSTTINRYEERILY